MHGPARIIGSRHLLSKLSWTLLVLCSSGMLIYQIYIILNNYRNYPVVTYIEDKVLPELVFPAVTICPSNAFSSSAVSVKIDSDPLKNYSDTEILKLPLFGFRHSNHVKFQNYILNSTTDADVMDYMAKQRDGESMFLARFESACVFGYKKFCKYPTDFTQMLSVSNGVCHTFNHNGTFIQIRAGSSQGLTMIIFANMQNLIPLTSEENGDGVLIIIHPHNEFPFSLDEGILVPPGTYTKVSLKKIDVIRKEFPHASNCTNGKHKTLIFPGRYTRKNCLETCLALYALEICGKLDIITQTYLPKHLKTKFHKTNISDGQCGYDMAILQEQHALGCDCPASCHEETYQKTTSYSKWPSQADLLSYKRIFGAALGLSNATFTDEYIYNNFIRLNIFFDQMSYQRVVEVPEWTTTKLISDIGGQMGMWIGASVFSLIELLVLCGCILSGSLLSRNKKEEIANLNGSVVQNGYSS